LESKYKVMVASDFDRTLSSEKEGFIMRRELIEEVNRFSSTNLFVIVTGRERRFMKLLAPGLMPTGWVLENGALIILDKEVIVNAPPEWPRIREKVITVLGGKKLSYSCGEVIVYVDKARKNGLDINVPGARIEWNREDAMIMPEGVDKGSGLNRLKQMLGFEGTVIAVGDSENDFPLFKAADIKVAVANALPAVKDVVDMVLDKENGEGVAELLRMISSGSLRI